MGSSKTGYLDRYFRGDKDFDWWGVALEEGETYVIDMKGPGDSTPARDNPQTIADPLVALHNSAGFQVAVNDNIQEFNDGVANYNSRTTYTVPDGEGGTYYVSAVRGGTHLGTYEITVQLSE